MSKPLEKDYEWIPFPGGGCECGYEPEIFICGFPQDGDKVRCLGCGRVGRVRYRAAKLVVKWD